eukprot:2325550-Amphidinium_carterae.2
MHAESIRLVKSALNQYNNALGALYHVLLVVWGTELSSCTARRHCEHTHCTVSAQNCTFELIGVVGPKALPKQRKRSMHFPTTSQFTTGRTDSISR